jgi:cation:H+ antiporter
MYPADWPLSIHIAILAASGGLVAYTGTKMAGYAKELAQRTGLGQAMTGALFLGASTSLSGIITSVTAAAGGHPELAASNAVGGIAAQTVFLAIADRVYSRANLEHAAASDENMLQGALLIALLSLTLLAASVPSYTVFGVHPVTPVLLLAYAFGQRLVYQAQNKEMWRPRMTEYTQTEEMNEGTSDGTESSAELHNASSGTGPKSGTDRSSGGSESLTGLWTKFVAVALLLAVLGYLLASAGVVVAERTGLNETVLGGIFTAVSTSFPELVTAVAAVRMGALTLAVSDIIGGNAFDMIFLAVADTAFRDGSLYHAMGSRPTFLVMMTILLTSVLLLGLIRREKHGIANIGFESVLMVLIYAGGFALIFTVMG